MKIKPIKYRFRKPAMNGGLDTFNVNCEEGMRGDDKLIKPTDLPIFYKRMNRWNSNCECSIYFAIRTRINNFGSIGDYEGEAIIFRFDSEDEQNKFYENYLKIIRRKTIPCSK